MSTSGLEALGRTSLWYGLLNESRLWIATSGLRQVDSGTMAARQSIRSINHDDGYKISQYDKSRQYKTAC